MIKLSSLNGKQGRIVRETTAPFVMVIDGEQKTEQVRVRYYSLSTKESRDQAKEAEKNSDGVTYWSDILFPVLESLPDIVDDKTGLPVTITKKLLENINGMNLRAIFQAIQEDAIPKPKSTK
jgi:hypothetical protein